VGYACLSAEQKAIRPPVDRRDDKCVSAVVGADCGWWSAD
jgi:hypothetical protein